MDVVNADFSDAFFEGGYMWIFDNRIQALCKVDLAGFNMEIISFYKSKKKFAVRRIYLYENKFYLVQAGSMQILVYNREEQNEDAAFCLIPLLYENREISVVHEYSGNICFLSNYADGKIFCFNMSAQKYYEKKSIASLVKEKIPFDAHIGINSYLYGNTVWFTFYETNYYGRYNIEEENIELFQIEDRSVCLDNICFDGEDVWLTQTNSSNIICAGKKTVKVSGEQFYTKIYNSVNWIVVLPKYEHRIVLVQKGTFDLLIINLPLCEYEIKQRLERNMLRCCEYRDRIYIFPHGIKDLFVLEEKKLAAKRKKLKCANYIKLWSERETEYLYENPALGIDTLVQFCGRNTKLFFAENEKKRNMGNIIWNNMKQIS